MYPDDNQDEEDGDEPLPIQDPVIAAFMAVFKATEQSQREALLLTFIKPMLELMDTEDLHELVGEIKASELPQDHPTLIAVLELIEGQIGLRSMGLGDDAEYD